MPTYPGADGTPLHYDDRGDGAPVVVVAGGAGRHPDYLGDLAGICAGHRMIVVHARGVGKSRRGIDSPTRAEEGAGSWWQQAEDLEQLREHLGVPALTIVAHSAGTRIATAYAARFPDRVARMLLVTPPASPLVKGVDDRAEIAQRRSDDEAFRQAVRILDGDMPVDDEDALNRWQQDIAPVSYARWGTREQEHASVGRFSLETTLSYFSVPAPADFSDRVGRVRAPVLVIACAEDYLTGLAPVVELSQLFPHGEVAVLEACGHYPWVEQPAAFRAAARPFLEATSA